MAKFMKGQSGNPKGRPLGSKHKTTIAAQDLLDGEAETLTRKVVELAKGGNLVALKLCLERLLPLRKDRSISLKLPKLEGVEDIPKAIEVILNAVADGEITPGEGQAVASMMEAYRKGADLADMEARLLAMEAVLKGRKYNHGKRKSGKTL